VERKSSTRWPTFARARDHQHSGQDRECTPVAHTCVLPPRNTIDLVFQANTGTTFMAGSTGTIDLGFGMASGTSASAN